MLSKFGKGGQSASRRRSEAGSGLSLIGGDVQITGHIVSQGEVQIDGRFDGDITCSRLLVGESGRIAGEISADHVRVHGEVVGKIDASAVVIARSARITGDITHNSVEIEAGAELEGRLIRKTVQPAPAPDPALAATPERVRLAPPRPDKGAGKGKDGGGRDGDSGNDPSRLTGGVAPSPA